MSDSTSTKTKPKGILKKPSNPSSSTSSPASSAQDPRQLAIQHANILQNRKDLEASILKSLEILSQYPQSTTSSASDPAPVDVTGFKNHVRLFQPSDYDDLVEERNVNDLCGYTLCPNPKPNTKGGKWTVKRGKIVDKHEMEKWCSDDCKKRALYVKVQLSETAAWERAGIADISIDLLGEDRSQADKAAQKAGEAQLEAQRQAAKDSAALALERGDREEEGLPSKMGKLDLADLTVKEKETRPPANDWDTLQDEDHLRIEGHRTGEKTGKKRY